MKLSKKKVITLALAVCLIATLSFGSLAWFTDDDSVTNEFMIAGSEDENPDKIFSVDVWEDATPTDDPNGEDKIQDGIKYGDILPGDKLYKEAHLENTGSYPQYVRAIVTISNGRVWQDIFDKFSIPLTDIVNVDTDALYNDTVISYYDGETDSLVYELYLEQILPVGGDYILFTDVQIPTAMDRYQAAEMAGGFNITVTADAVQTEHVGENVIEAFTTVGLYELRPFVDAADLNDLLKTPSTDRIILAAGTQSVTIDNPAADLTIDLNGAEEVIITGNVDNLTLLNVGDDPENTDNNINLSNATGTVTIKDSRLYSTSGSNFGAAIVPGLDCDLVVESCEFVCNSTGKTYGIYKSGASASVTVRNSTFKGFTSWVIQINNSINGNAVVDGCTFINCEDGIFKCKNGGGITGDFTFTNNTLINCTGHDGKEEKMFDVKAAAGTVTVTGNTRDGAAYNPGAANGINP